MGHAARARHPGHANLLSSCCFPLQIIFCFRPSRRFSFLVTPAHSRETENTERGASPGLRTAQMVKFPFRAVRGPEDGHSPDPRAPGPPPRAVQNHSRASGRQERPRVWPSTRRPDPASHLLLISAKLVNRCDLQV